MACKLTSFTDSCGYMAEGITDVYLVDRADLVALQFEGDGNYDSCKVVSCAISGDLIAIPRDGMAARYVSSTSGKTITHSLELFKQSLSSDIISRLALATNRRYFVVFRSGEGKLFSFGQEAGASVSYSGQTADTIGAPISLTCPSIYPLLELDALPSREAPHPPTYTPTYVAAESTCVLNGDDIMTGQQQASMMLRVSAANGEPLDSGNVPVSVSGNKQAVELLSGYMNPNPALYEVTGTYEAGEAVGGVASSQYNATLCEPGRSTAWRLCSVLIGGSHIVVSPMLGTFRNSAALPYTVGSPVAMRMSILNNDEVILVGRNQLAVAWGGGGGAWDDITAHLSLGADNIIGGAVGPDGSVIALIGYTYAYVSTNGGDTFTRSTPSGGYGSLSSVAIDATKIVVTDSVQAQFYVYTLSTHTWSTYSVPGVSGIRSVCLPFGSGYGYFGVAGEGKVIRINSLTSFTHYQLSPTSGAIANSSGMEVRADINGINAIAFHRYYLAGSDDRGVWVSNDSGLSWTKRIAAPNTLNAPDGVATSFSGKTMVCTAHPTPGSYYLSQDYGHTFQTVVSGLGSSLGPILTFDA